MSHPRGRLRPEVLLVVLVLAVPLLVGGAGVASLLLLRAGYGVLVWGLLPLLGLLLSAGVLGGVLGRAARGAPPKDPDPSAPRRDPKRGDG